MRFPLPRTLGPASRAVVLALGLAAPLAEALPPSPGGAATTRPAPVAARGPSPASTQEARDEALARARTALLPGGEEPAGLDGRALFERALASEAFFHEAVGPFDVYVLRAPPGGANGDAKEKEGDKGKSGRSSKGAAKAKDKEKDKAAILSAAGGDKGLHKLADAAIAGLKPMAALVERRFPKPAGDAPTLVAGKRFPIVLVPAPAHGEADGFDEVLALLDRCEDLGYSGWKPDNLVWSDAQRQGSTARTWEVQVVRLGHPDASNQPDGFLAHGLGYQSLAFLANRLLRLGSWGLVPPWLAQGLVDELDIEAYGEAWVGGEWWVSQTPGWYREGWSGFVPEGQSPPPPITGPPADLATTVSKTGDSWQSRENSRTRHWEDLAADRKSAAPASFAFMAENESFLPRDRALARLALWLVLAQPSGSPQDLLFRLDRPARRGPDGMPDSDPLTVIVAAALGGEPEVARLEALPTRDLLHELGRDEIARDLESLGAGGLLALTDHRAQSAWLYGEPDLPMEARSRVFTRILEVEYWQQMAEWKALGAALDRGVAAALAAGGSTWPSNASRQAAVHAAFLAAIGG